MNDELSIEDLAQEVHDMTQLSSNSLEYMFVYYVGARMDQQETVNQTNIL